jgi:hypothetical protein
MTYRTPSPVLATLAQLYRDSPAGLTGEGRGVLVDFEALMEKSGAQRGNERQAAEAILVDAERAAVVELDRHSRDHAIVERVRLRREQESAFFVYIGSKTPTTERKELAEWFGHASNDLSGTPTAYHHGWQKFWSDLAASAAIGKSVEPFTKRDTQYNRRLFAALPILLSWSGESLQRMASCVLFGDSKELARRQNALETCLARITGGAISSLGDLGITENPRTVLVHGPVRLQLPEGILDCGLVHGPLAISEMDLRRTISATTTADRLVTVENPTSLLEIARLRSNDLLIGTSYPGTGTLLLLKLLPAEIPSWHFGDSDPAGFDILRDLRQRAERQFQSLHMAFRAASETDNLTAQERQLAKRLLDSPALTSHEKLEVEKMIKSGKGHFEQESLGRPTQRSFPYY